MPATDVGAVAWVRPDLGFAYRFTRAYHTGSDSLAYQAVTVRYRRTYSSNQAVEIGVGWIPAGAVASEVLGTYRFTRAFALKYGVVFDFNGEVKLLQPVVVAAVGF